ncbi:MAG: hypothetical protein QOE03_2436 [Micromonosporaceae bacterium]|nr:hypothetical protein [Micromonosporaceae bacterium]
MNARTVPGLITDIVYSADKVANLNDQQLIARCADFMINRRYFSGTVDEYATAIDATLRDGHIPAHALEISQHHSEAELLDFLALLKKQLDNRRPWPKPAFVKLETDQWATFANAAAIARVNLPKHRIVGILNKDFDSVVVGELRLPVMILELRSSEVVALMGSLEPRSTVFTLLHRDRRNMAEEVVSHFCEFTGIPSDAVQPITVE